MYTVTINNTPFNIVLADEKEEKLNPDDDSIFLGLTEYTPQPTISIRRGMCYANTRITVIHELIHAFVYAYGHSINGEEDMCRFISAQIDDMIRLAERILIHFDNVARGIEHE